jgi:pheromone a factor receptor
VVTLFSLFSINVTESFPAWASVHSQISKVQVVTVPDDVRQIVLAWWGVPVVSIVYLVLLYAIGEESRDISKWLREKYLEYSKKRRPQSSPLLPL